MADTLPLGSIPPQPDGPRSLPVMTEISTTVKETFAFISERGVLGGLYLGGTAFSLILSTPDATSQPHLLPWAGVVCLLMGLIIASTTYELLLPVFRILTNWIARLGFNRALRGNGATDVERAHFNNYGQIRRFRELFLASGESAHLKDRIKKDEKLRQTLTYFATASLAGLLIVYIATSLFKVSANVKNINLVIVWYILAATLVGQVSRSYSFGRAVGLAFIGTEAPKRQPLMQ